MQSISRRLFLEDAMLATAALAATALAPQVFGADEKPTGNPSNKVRVAVLGCRIRGKQHVAELVKIPDCEIAYVCDPDRDLANELAASVEKQQGRAAKAVQDMRKVFDDKSVDAVFIATPNHWHALAAIWAMQSGKDVYVEKPVSHNISEGRRIVQVSRKTNRICQGGTQNRSNMALAEAVEYMKAGKLGEVKLARSIIYGGRGSIGAKGEYKLPENVDYNLFAGPAPLSPLTRPKLHYDWHWDWQTGNGELGNNNIHSIDICRWGLGLTGLGRSAISYGGRFGYIDAGETPNTQVCIFDYGNKTIVAETRGLKSAPFRQGFTGGWLFHGAEGSIAGSSLFDKEGKLVSTFTGKTKSENHFANFLNAVRSRKRESLNAEILEGHQSTALCHVGNISWRLGAKATPAEVGEQLKKLKVHDDVQETLDRTMQHLKDNNADFEKTPLILGTVLMPNSENENFGDNAKANAFLTREYRKPFVVPGASEI
ncbi:MAG: Gfo/Idh/MocA family oxidoreductase [Planctomycetes bacterium]|nr:Gfo/Idh/MocA family oxidoreductase [Planctomycetota bacterium]